MRTAEGKKRIRRWTRAKQKKMKREREKEYARRRKGASPRGKRLMSQGPRRVSARIPDSRGNNPRSRGNPSSNNSLPDEIRVLLGGKGKPLRHGKTEYDLFRIFHDTFNGRNPTQKELEKLRARMNNVKHPEWRIVREKSPTGITWFRAERITE